MVGSVFFFCFMESCVDGESIGPGFRNESFDPCYVLKATLISLLNVEKHFFLFAFSEKRLQRTLIIF